MTFAEATSPTGRRREKGGRRGRPYTGYVSRLIARLAAPEFERLRAAFMDPAWSPGVARDFRDHIVLSVSGILLPHLRDQAMLWRHVGRGGGQGGSLPAASGPAENDVATLAYMETEGWAALFEHLPLLQSAVIAVIGREVAAAERLAADFRNDLPLLSESFFAGGRMSRVGGVRPGLSDPHLGRRSVCALRFTSGHRLIYKPRPVAMESGLAGIAAWLAAQGAPHAPRVPRVLDGGDHGWMEFIPMRSCRTAAGVRRFYERLGALAGLLACLGAVDCHADNFIAHGDWPVLIDSETLFHPRLAASPDFTLLETEIFQRTLVTPTGQTIVYGGFDADYADLGARMPGNSQGAAGHPPINLPRLAGASMPQAAHAAETRAGISAMAGWLGRHATAFLADGGPVRAMTGGKARVVLRPTGMYAAVLGASLQATALSDRSRRDAVLAQLRRHDDRALAPDVWRLVHEVETASLAGLDIPYFLLDLESGDLLDGIRSIAPRAFAPVSARIEQGFEAALRSCANAGGPVG